MVTVSVLQGLTNSQKWRNQVKNESVFILPELISEGAL